MATGGGNGLVTNYVLLEGREQSLDICTQSAIALLNIALE